MPRIGIVWDFDGTLIPADSTTKVVEILNGQGRGSEFWNTIKALKGVNERPEWEQLLGSDAPIWMYSLSRLAFEKRVPLNEEFFREIVLPELSLYSGVLEFLEKLKLLSTQPRFKSAQLEIHHFIVSAGLQDLVSQFFPPELVTWVFGCKYKIVSYNGEDSLPESIPVFCMDETMKTRSLFEISKGSFLDSEKGVNERVEDENLWAPFKNIIYIGDGDTDVPALSLTRSRGGTGVVVFNPDKEAKDIRKRLQKLVLNKRSDYISPADYSINGELYKYLETRCFQILNRYEAESLDLRFKG
jgi:2-hydroxy-3-keto-5-methylthiopentenyl-1-phosphate phosphatase